ncbi:MAG TPA: OmpA family protein [Candidatus Sulfotelmatobacter sp.]|nr:OmpA family protein [Candidatus Sulfotelmatobacter sp.]
MIVRRVLLLLAALAGLAACQQREALFVVFPNADGSSGAVAISDGKNDGKPSVLLDKPYAAGEVRGGTAEAVSMTPAEAQKTFADAIAARPLLPRHFRLYFAFDTDKLTAESEKVYRGVFADIRQRAAYEVEVVGHTDSLGARSYNQQLSLQRAKAIRDRLVADGLDPRSISIAGRGELDPAVPTRPGVAEPQNRRVEITVR